MRKKKEFRSGGEFLVAAFWIWKIYMMPASQHMEMLREWRVCNCFALCVFAGPRSRKLKRKEKKPEDKRPRTAFTSEQLARLKREFQVCYPAFFFTRFTIAALYHFLNLKFHVEKYHFCTFSIIDLNVIIIAFNLMELGLLKNVAVSGVALKCCKILPLAHWIFYKIRWLHTVKNKLCHAGCIHISFSRG